MEGSRSEAVFDSYGLNPQLFINEVLNTVDDLVDEAFDFCQQQAPAVVGGDAVADRSEELRRGITSLHHAVRATLNKRMSLWERYCLLHCFSVPEGFSSDKSVGIPNVISPLASLFNSSGDALLPQDELHNAELDSQIVSLRKKLAMVGDDSAALQREICKLEKHSVLHSGYHESISEVLRLLEENSVHKIFQEIEESTSKLYQEMEILRTETIPSGTIGNPGEQNGDRWINRLGPSTKLEDIQKAADILKLFRKP
ncbi:hypothetical protein Taro_013771 [Colocasia esculenta]|uniref:Protein MIS12 homolog n=1 Tax=Colocasia esculenta TaxID=4460 RepID=A0A843UCU0_COLES|nr:hypothetical protein [Colocasia esculenta]